MVDVCLGLRVVRGPSWNWPAQDGGEGGLGTVVEVGGCPGSSSPLGTAVVLWDTGNKTNYRCGYSSKFDLRVYDTGPTAGSHHYGYMCDGCETNRDVYGIRWKCLDCPDYDLCTPCYHADKHNLDHRFTMVPSHGMPGREVGRRRAVSKIPAKGLVTGAKVARGLNWKWDSQDDQPGRVGVVGKVQNCRKITARSVAEVTWPSNCKNVYRVGHLGKVDLRCIDMGTGSTYYRDHLPILVSENVGVSEASRPMRVGDFAQVAGLEVDVCRMMQEGHGGWCDEKDKVMQQIGVVEKIDANGDIFVNYPYHGRKTFQFHPAVLTKVVRLRSGDKVKMIDDTSTMKAMLIGHGEWAASMSNFIGKTGTIICQLARFDVRVKFGSNRWCFHPGCLELVKGPDGDEFDQSECRDDHNDDSDAPGLDLVQSALGEVDGSRLEQLVLQFLGEASGTPAVNMAKSVQDGETDKVRRELERTKGKHVNDHIGEHKQTCLHIAAGLGMLDIIDLLVAHGAELSSEDTDGDTPMHYAAIGNEAHSVAKLHRYGADVNVCNHKASTPLHTAALRGHERCVNKLLELDANVGMQDGVGDSPLHDAAGNDHSEIVDALLDAGAPVALRNDRGFNSIHHTALKGHHYVLQKLLHKAPHLLNTKKDDGFTPLHLAVFNNHVGAATVLLRSEGCEINALTSKNNTPLMMAVHKGSVACTELLVSYGADLDAQDEDGEMVMHFAMRRQSLVDIVRANQGTESTEHHSPMLGQLINALDLSSESDKTTTAIACFLAREGCSLSHRNNNGKTPMDLCINSEVRRMVDSYKKPRGSSRIHGSNKVGAGATLSSPDGVASGSATSSARSAVQESRPAASAPIAATGSATTATATTITVDHPLPDCIVCDNKANIKFTPCGDNILCETCAARSKKCAKCKAPVAGRLTLRYIEPAALAGPDEEACMLCENKATVTFSPCGHIITCEECCIRTRLCMKCRTPVTGMNKDGEEIRRDSAPREGAAEGGGTDRDAVSYCPICLENPLDTAFLCGHRTCEHCSGLVYECPICRQPITNRIKLF